MSVVSDSLRPHRRQLTRLLCPWDSPGKNTGVGCHFLLQSMKVKSEVAQSCPTDSLQPQGLQPTRPHRPWDFPGKSTGVGCHCLLQMGWWATSNHANKWRRHLRDDRATDQQYPGYPSPAPHHKGTLSVWPAATLTLTWKQYIILFKSLMYPNQRGVEQTN